MRIQQWIHCWCHNSLSKCNTFKRHIPSLRVFWTAKLYFAKNSRLPVHREFRYLLCFYWKSSLAWPRIDHLERWTTDHLASPRITHYLCVSTEEKCAVLLASPRITSHHRASPRITSNLHRSVETRSKRLQVSIKSKKSLFLVAVHIFFNCFVFHGSMSHNGPSQSNVCTATRG